MKCFRFIKLSWLPAVTISGENLIGKQAFVPFPLVFVSPSSPTPTSPPHPNITPTHSPLELWFCPADVGGITRRCVEVWSLSLCVQMRLFYGSCWFKPRS